MERLERNKESLQLPESLQNEIQRKDEDSEGQFNDGKPKMARRRPGLPRKEQRKKEREAQKRQRIELHERKVTMKKEARLKRDDTSNSNVNKKRKRDDSSAREAPAAKRQSPSAKKQKSNGGDKQAQPSSKKKTPQKETKAKVQEAAQKKKEATKKKVEVLPFTMKRDQEDEDLAYLEAKLGLTKSGAKKRLASELADDGLGELLEGLSDMDSDDFSEDDMAMYRDKDSGDDAVDDEEDEDEEDDDEDGLEDDEDDDIEEDGDEGAEVGVDEDGDGEEEEEEEEELDEEIDELQAKLEALKQKKAQQAEEKKKLEKQAAQQDGKKQKEKAKENGQNADVTTAKAKTDAQPVAAAGKYVPPSMRQSSEEERLNRQVRGLLNRLAQSNLHSVGTQLLAIYDDNSDILVNEALCATLLSDLEGMRKGSSAFVLTYAGLVLFLHAQLGTQIGGFVVERVAKAFEESHEDGNSEACSNHVLMLCHLCGFGVVSVGLIFDLMKRLLDSFTPLDIELLLSILTHCGSQLRHDDPAALKEVIMKVQTNALQLKTTADAGDADKDASSGSAKAAKTTTATAAQNKSLEGLPPRVRFMLETIYDLKNNKTKQASDANTAQVSQMKTMVKKLLKGKNEGQELRTTWNTLLTGKGRWWLVGSAFAEVHFDKRPMKGGSSAAGDGDEVDEALEGYDSEIVKLASQQRMTTPVKKAVFCILMSSEDYLDAFEKLLRLNLKNKQDREIIHVLERVFNPFYAHLAAKLCSFDYNYKFTLQYAFWDKFKQLPSLPVRTISNLGMLLAHLIANFSLSLSVLKAVEFSEQMEAHTTLFLTLVVKTLLTQFGEEVTTKLFERITGTKELFTFREQLLLFLQTLYVREKKKKDASPESRQEWPLLAERLKAAKQLLKRSTDILFE